MSNVAVLVARQLRIRRDVTERRLTYRDRCVLAFMRASNDWHTVTEIEEIFQFKKNGSDTLPRLARLGYLQRQRVGLAYQYAVKS